MRTRRIGSSRSYCCCKCCCFTVRSCGSNSVESGYRHCVFIFFFLCLTKFGDGVTTESVTKWSKDLSSKLRILFDESTKYEEIIRSYKGLAEAEVFDPRLEVRTVKRRIENYLRERAKMAWDAKVSLESKELEDVRDAELNDPMSKHFVRYLNAKTQNDAATVYKDGHLGEVDEVNATREYKFRHNVNFYGISTNSEASAVHVPTPIYNRNAHLLRRIEWSNIDQVYRRNRERLKDLSFQKFCSESGFMRYFPAAPWIFDSVEEGLDLFDCRSTEWFIDAATMSKNVLILLDLSGSMLGQRLEIAKGTIQSIMDTLSDNDFFNIMAFSKNIDFLDQCVEEGLVQATMRNKKLLQSRLQNISSEGKAEYEKALSKAFTVLMNLPGTVFWRTKEELARDREQNALDPDLHYVTLEDNILVLSHNYIDAIKKFTGNSGQMGCNDVIMLITDGAPGFFKEIFELYNNEKRIRFFTFLVGEEATDFDQVRWMACNNRGFMVHLTNLADVQEKVQQYVKVMSRSISRQSAAIHQENAIWSGTGRERMSNEFVISVSYPVVLDGSFMGVSAVSIPLTELAQIAHPILVGGMSYMFMLDNNGYAIFHPQLRPVDPVTGDVKATFSNMNFIEIDFQVQNISQVSLTCTNNELKDLSTLFSVDNMRRVYPQKNHYYAECIDGTHFTVAMSVAEGDQARLKPRSAAASFADIDLGWFDDPNWRIHPKWRYCLLNDSDTDLTREEALLVYVRQMRQLNDLPVFCRSRRKLMERLLLDMRATSGIRQSWGELDAPYYEKNGVHLTFFSSPSGFIRFANRTLENVRYNNPYGDPNSTDFSYRHFILQLNARSTDSDYYKRAVRQKGRIVFDLNRKTRLWQDSGNPTPYGNYENETLLAYAFKALYHDDALIGVVGMEFLYDTFIQKMKDIGCLPDDDRTRCYLLDEHAYVVYTSQRDTTYADYIREFSAEMNHEVPIAVGNLAVANRTHRHVSHHHTTYSQHRHQYKPVQVQRKQQSNAGAVDPSAATVSPVKSPSPVVLGTFFGGVNRVAEWTMELLIKRGYYTRTTFVDNQGTCDPDPPASTTTAAASSLSRPFLSVMRLVAWLLTSFVDLIHRFSLFPLSLPQPVPAAVGEEKLNRFSCRKKSRFYLANPHHKAGSSALLEENLSERPCKHNAAQCAVKVYAQWVESTNLLLVVIRQGSHSECYDSAHCAMSTPPAVPFGFYRITPENANEDRLAAEEESGGEGVNGDAMFGTYNAGPDENQDDFSCPKSSTKARDGVTQCLRDDFLEDESGLPCSGTGSTRQRIVRHRFGTIAGLFAVVVVKSVVARLLIIQ